MKYRKKPLAGENRSGALDKNITVYNLPRLSNGAYGVEKDTISEEYSIKYVSETEKDLVQENFLKAYLDAQRYLEAIGSKLL